VVYGDSHKPETLAELADLLADDRVDLLFIDADHTYEGVKGDYETYSPLVRPGGIVAFHDILTHPNMPYVAVDILWRQLSGVMEEIITDPPTWGGIGVLHVAADLAVAR
jgi:predicted O-methyltransferase YrrM